MKKMTKVTSLACALMLAAGTAALAENAATETAPEVPAITQTAPETQAAPEAPAAAAQDTEAAYLEALEAYHKAKESGQGAELEAELKAFVASGAMTQEQADLLLAKQNEQKLLAEALEAYQNSVQNKAVTDFEAELKSYVEAGTMTQEQADALLKYYKEQLANQGQRPRKGGFGQKDFRLNGRGGRADSRGNSRDGMNGQRGSNGMNGAAPVAPMAPGGSNNSVPNSQAGPAAPEGTPAEGSSL